MKKNDREPYEKEDRKLDLLGWAFVIFYVIFIIYLYTTKTKPDWMPKTIIIDLPVIYILCILLYCHIKYRDKR
jgi:heme/copper-type cytochrome/quinol oxidase subunit 2